MSKNYATKPTIVDGVLKEWGDRLYNDEEIRGKGRVGRSFRKQNLFGGSASFSGQSGSGRLTATAVREKIYLTANRVPEVMVKITGSSRNAKSFKHHIDYISRGGKIKLEDKRGKSFEGKGATIAIRDAAKLPQEWSTRKEAFHIILSMPAGTNPQGVAEAARNFAAKTFHKHFYFMALHDGTENDHLKGREDGKNQFGKAGNPHVHLVVKAEDDKGVRLNPRKRDLQTWRETFAEELREQGIEANATPRHYRANAKYPMKSVQKNIRQGKPAETRYDPHVEEKGREVYQGYAVMAEALKRSNEEDDKRLAGLLEQFLVDTGGVEKSRDDKSAALER